MTDAVHWYQMHIGGNWCDAKTGDVLHSENPYLKEIWARVPNAGKVDVDDAVSAARSALLGEWGATTARQRGKLIMRLGEKLSEKAEFFGRIEATDNGKLMREMHAQAAYLPDWFHYFGAAADKLSGKVIPSERPNFHIYTRYEPVGIVGAITPWNSPIALLGFKLAPALAAGCTFVVKPSEHTPVSTLEFAKLFEEVGFPPGVFNVVTGDAETGRALSGHPGIDKMAFTGSGATGRKVAIAALDNFTRFSLELGGKSPNIVFADADIEAAANGIIAGVFAATGQTCMAGSRILVHENVKEALIQRLSARARMIVMGDPMDPSTEMGPIATGDQFEKVMGILERARTAGATFICGGKADEKLGGLFIEPTLVDNVRPDMEILTEEVFGPVATVQSFRNEAEAVELANDTRYGLAAGIWTKDVQRATRVAHQVRAGTIWINAYRVVAPNVPFGGYGHSGMGRENGFDAIRDFCEVKAVYSELSGATRDPFSIG